MFKVKYISFNYESWVLFNTHDITKANISSYYKKANNSQVLLLVKKLFWALALEKIYPSTT